MEHGTSYESFGLDLSRGHLSSYPLVLAAQMGDRAAFQELVQSYDSRVMRIALALTDSETAAQGIYCGVLTDAFTSVNQLDSSSSVFIWLYRILVRHCLEYCRRRSIDGRSYADDEPASRLARALFTLPPTERVVFLLKQFQALKVRTLAEIFNAPPEFIIATLQNAISHLRAQLKTVARHPA